MRYLDAFSLAEILQIFLSKFSQLMYLQRWTFECLLERLRGHSCINHILEWLS
jgi:hypothetical protein